VESTCLSLYRAVSPWNNRPVAVRFKSGRCFACGDKPDYKGSLYISALTTLALRYKTAAKLDRMGRIEADSHTISLFHDVRLPEMPYIFDDR